VTILVCTKNEPIYWERAAAADKFEVSSAADADHSAGLRPTPVLQSGIVDFGAAGHADVMDRGQDANS